MLMLFSVLIKFEPTEYSYSIRILSFKDIKFNIRMKFQIHPIRSTKMNTHLHTHTYTNPYIYIYTLTHIHPHTHTCVHACMHTGMHAHTHTPHNTHTLSIFLYFLIWKTNSLNVGYIKIYEIVIVTSAHWFHNLLSVRCHGSSASSNNNIAIELMTAPV